jgi:hypothetical protein
VAAVDDDSDKEWMAVGPDPVNCNRDNLYIAWVSFQPTRSELRFARSTDGGATWTSKTIFVPVAVNGLSLVSQYAPNPTVDQITGRLFVPFHQNTVSGISVIRVLVSDDAGDTFHLAEFDAPGAPDAFGFPNVTPGTRTDCGLGNGGIRLVLHQGADLGGGRRRLPGFRQATGLVTQPTAAAAAGTLVLALNSSTSTIQGDPASLSEIRLLVSTDGGDSFSGPFAVAGATGADPQHVHPAVAIDKSGKKVQAVYYVAAG